MFKPYVPDAHISRGHLIDARSALLERLITASAVLLRDCFDSTVEGFKTVASALIPKPMSYKGGDSLRKSLGGNTYTASHYPSFMALPVHNERAYTSVVPDLIVFGCITQAEFGGETPICDCAGMIQDLPEELCHKVRQQGLSYIRRLKPDDDAFFRGWKNTYQTKDRHQAVAASRAEGNQCRWDSDVLELVHNLSGIVEHKKTGEEIWLNQITSYHPSVVEYVQRLTPSHYLQSARITPDMLPRVPTDCTLGDGTPFTREELKAIWNAYDTHTTKFLLTPGDILLLDNYRVAHGRAPFTGERFIAVSMGAWD